MSQIVSETERYFSWSLNQERLDTLANLLYGMGTMLNIVRSSDADLAWCFLNDLRTQSSIAGAEDPFPDMPLIPSFFESDRKRRRCGC
jgi:hypothetical protein